MEYVENVVGFLQANRTLVLVLTVLAVAFLLLRSQQSDVGGENWETVVRTGKPVVVEFFSNT